MYQYLSFLDKRGDTKVRFSLDEDSRKCGTETVERFRKLCHIIEEIYPNVAFFGGCSLGDNNPLYVFKNRGHDYCEMPEARYGRFSRLIPQIGAWLHNGKESEETKMPVVYRDFVEIQ